MYDGAFRGVHIDEIMRRYGYLVIAKLPELSATDANLAPALVRTPQGTRATSHPLGTVTHDTPTGSCSHLLAAINGRPIEIALDDSGDPVIISTPTKTSIKRARRGDGAYRFNGGYRITCPNGDFTTWLSPHASKPGDPRPEILRLLPHSDPASLDIRGIRSDAESTHSQYKRTLITERAMTLGWRRGLIDYYSFAWYANAMTAWHQQQIERQQTSHTRRR